MVDFHATVGSLVLLAYLVLIVAYALGSAGREVRWARPLSFVAAGLLAIQYVIGFGLLSGDHDQTFWHYVVALAALITVGLEHGYAGSRPTPASRNRLGALAALGTLLIVLAAYIIGQSS